MPVNLSPLSHLSFLIKLYYLKKVTLNFIEEIYVLLNNVLIRN